MTDKTIVQIATLFALTLGASQGHAMTMGDLKQCIRQSVSQIASYDKIEDIEDGLARKPFDLLRFIRYADAGATGAQQLLEYRDCADLQPGFAAQNQQDRAERTSRGWKSINDEYQNILFSSDASRTRLAKILATEFGKAGYPNIAKTLNRTHTTIMILAIQKAQTDGEEINESGEFFDEDIYVPTLDEDLLTAVLKGFPSESEISADRLNGVLTTQEKRNLLKYIQTELAK